MPPIKLIIHKSGRNSSDTSSDKGSALATHLRCIKILKTQIKNDREPSKERWEGRIIP